ncbi:hypothetical protein SAMN04489743_3800 [Pseudarthrobacter equi]|uniref:Uncharacterized protein n=1 Tax=Pseudarthrobacter equi TaxID=728066 RepID=A0A1H2BN93_9MICC|nr:hypothetical protein SAMN04489743_3800 [Pseudarthrobacter equi]
MLWRLFLEPLRLSRQAVSRHVSAQLAAEETV